MCEGRGVISEEGIKGLGSLRVISEERGSRKKRIAAESQSLCTVMWIGGWKAKRGSASTWEVLNAPVTRLRPLFWTICNLFNKPFFFAKGRYQS
jgi:hypothetical protein